MFFESIEAKEERDRRELEERYPEGSPERKVLEYSRSTHRDEEVHPFLRSAFWLLMGITVLMSLSALIGFLQSR